MATTTTAKRPQQQQQAQQQTLTPQREEQVTPAPQGQELIGSDTAASADQLDAVAAHYAMAIAAPGIKAARRACIIADGIEALERALPAPLLTKFMRLMNTKLGFMTDRDPAKDPNKKPYDQETVKRCLVHALLNGFLPVNNEFNIIASGFYPAQNGWKRKVEELPGLTDLEMIPGPIALSNGFRCAQYAARWKVNGEPQSLKDSKGNPGRTFLIISYEKSTPDNILGKAKAKAYRAIYEQVTGTEHTAPDDPPLAEGEIPPTNGGAKRSRTDALADKIGAEQPGPGEALENQQAPSGQKPASAAQHQRLEELRGQLDITREEAGIKEGMTEHEAALGIEDMEHQVAALAGRE